LHFSRALTIAKGVTVEVRIWNAKQKKGFGSLFLKFLPAINNPRRELWTKLRHHHQAVALHKVVHLDGFCTALPLNFDFPHWGL
jgi:hypothetical protein